MSTLSRSEQARINGAKSKGPITEEGKAKSSGNSLKHGLTCRTLVLQNEEKADFETLLHDYNDRFCPADRVELDLVVEMAGARWRIIRALAMETALIDKEMCKTAHEFEASHSGHDEDLRKAVAFQTLSAERTLPNVHRAQSRLELTYNRALKNLLMLQQQRKNEPEPAPEPLPIEPIDTEPPTLLSPPKAQIAAEMKEKLRIAAAIQAMQNEPKPAPTPVPACTEESLSNSDVPVESREPDPMPPVVGL